MLLEEKAYGTCTRCACPWGVRKTNNIGDGLQLYVSACYMHDFCPSKLTNYIIHILHCCAYLLHHTHAPFLTVFSYRNFVNRNNVFTTILQASTSIQFESSILPLFRHLHLYFICYACNGEETRFHLQVLGPVSCIFLLQFCSHFPPTMNSIFLLWNLSI